MARIRTLPPTIEDRSIVISLRRKLPTEGTAKLTSHAVSEPRILHRKVARWEDDIRPRLSKVEPKASSNVIDRAADNWWPLFAVAQLAGPRWATEARRFAAVKINCRGAGEAGPIQTRLSSICHSFWHRST
ncbi:MAG: DUF3631 domain-containing protein [Gemmatimonadaceae bacterium]|nr:DUF3631 domain-containing protein [Gemmatimonadaceae bacterium]